MRRGLIERSPSSSDARRIHVRLSTVGREVVAGLERRAAEAVAGMLSPLASEERIELVTALQRAERLLTSADGSVPREAGFILRPPEPGDLGWVVQRHGALYWQEYGWDNRFEALVAEIVADFRKNLDERRERCWIAEHQGRNVGSVFLVRHPEREGVCKLRRLLVEPSARGLGIGHRLVDECLRFARRCGYHTMVLWTNSVLHAARRIYEQRGFQLVHEEPHASFGVELIGQNWELAL
jgi:GNAT superfamily N-acetyltransferase